MRILFDTTALVAALVRSHPHKAECRPWLIAVQRSLHDGLLCTHSLAELYAAPTAMPLRPPLSPPEARQLLDNAITPCFRMVSLDEQDDSTALDLVTRRLLRSGAIFDALREVAARKAEADRLLTLNLGHFKRFRGESAGWLLDPRRDNP